MPGKVLNTIYLHPAARLPLYILVFLQRLLQLSTPTGAFLYGRKVVVSLGLGKVYVFACICWYLYEFSFICLTIVSCCPRATLVSIEITLLRVRYLCLILPSSSELTHVFCVYLCNKCFVMYHVTFQFHTRLSYVSLH